jgi:hypothetical protein
MTGVEIKINPINTEVTTVPQTTEIKPQIINTEIKGQTIAIETKIEAKTIEIRPHIPLIEITPVHNLNYNFTGESGYQELKTNETVTIENFTILSRGSNGLIPADCFDLNTWRVAGISLNASINGGSVLVQYTGSLTNPNWNWDLTRPIYVGQNGQLTQVILYGAVFSCQVATPVSPNTIFIEINEVLLR